MNNNEQRCVMTTKQGTATVEKENKMIPIAYDGDCSSVPVSAPTVAVALSSFEFKPGYVGFRFTEAAKATVTCDDGTEETFSRERGRGPTYYFGSKVMSVEDFETKPEFRNNELCDQFRKFSSWVLEDKANVLFESPGRGIRVIRADELKDTVIVNKQGHQLFPPKMA
jgi:hypothetical protein